MKRDSWSDELAGTLAAWVVLFPILILVWLYRAYEDRKAAEAAAEAAAVYPLPDELIHI